MFVLVGNGGTNTGGVTNSVLVCVEIAWLGVAFTSSATTVLGPRDYRGREKLARLLYCDNVMLTLMTTVQILKHFSILLDQEVPHEGPK